MIGWARPLLGGLLFLPAAALAVHGAALRGEGEAAAAYAHGSGLLDRGDLAGAAAAFTEAGAAADPELRRRALHNLALARLWMASGAAGAERAANAGAAADAAKEALRLGPWDADTRWNLALALRMLDGEGGGGGGAAGEGQGAPSLSQEEAGRVLDALRSGEGGRAAEGILSGWGRDTAGHSRAKGPPW